MRLDEPRRSVGKEGEPSLATQRIAARRPEISARLQAIRLRQRQSAQRRVTPEDVIFSFDKFKKLSPQAGADYRRVLRAAKIGESEVTFMFDGPGNRGLPQVLGQLTNLPKAWCEGTDRDGKKRDLLPDAAASGPLSTALNHCAD
jgi:microcin C transport system substrate-binding protein